MTDQLRPGVFRCAKCELRFVSSNLCTEVGKVEPDNTAQCPNNCGPAWPATWKADCQEAERLLAEASAQPAGVGELNPDDQVLVERVANALHAARRSPDNYPWFHAEADKCSLSRAMARAAIFALKAKGGVDG